jgi:hypothetical protein
MTTTQGRAATYRRRLLLPGDFCGGSSRFEAAFAAINRLVLSFTMVYLRFSSGRDCAFSSMIIFNSHFVLFVISLPNYLSLIILWLNQNHSFGNFKATILMYAYLDSFYEVHCFHTSQIMAQFQWLNGRPQLRFAQFSAPRELKLYCPRSDAMQPARGIQVIITGLSPDGNRNHHGCRSFEN